MKLSMILHQLERQQVWVYLAAILIGLALGSVAPGLSGTFEASLWPALGLLLCYLPAGAADAFARRVLRSPPHRRHPELATFPVPFVVWGLLGFLPADPAIRLGMLLVPCAN